MTRIEGTAHAPTIAIASAPDFLAAKAKCDDERASLNRLVSGDLAATATRMPCAAVYWTLVLGQGPGPPKVGPPSVVGRT